MRAETSGVTEREGSGQIESLKFDSFVLRKFLSLLWLLSFDEGLLYEDNLPIFTAV